MTATIRAWRSKLVGSISSVTAIVVLASLGTLAGLAWFVRSKSLRDYSESPVYRIGFRESPPYLIAQPDGSPAGLAVEVISEAAARANVRLQWVQFRGLNFEFLDSGAGELWPLGDNFDSHQYPTTLPWIRDSFSLLTRTNNAAPARIAVNDNPRTISLLQAAFPRAILVRVAGAANAMAAACAGSVDGAFGNARVLHQLLLNRPPECNGVPLHLHHVDGASIPLGIMFKAEARTPAEAIRTAIDEMAADGTLGRKFEKWAHSANNHIEMSKLLLESEGRTRFAWQVATVSGLALLALLAGTLLLYRAHRLSVAASRTKSIFLSMVSHELRTPLQGIIGVLDLLAKDNLTREQRSLTDTIKVSAGSLRRIVNDILEYSRIDAFRFELNPAPANLPHLVESVIALLADQAARKGLSLHREVPQPFPMLEVDASRLHQLLFNLADNAIKFTPSGEVRIIVSHQQTAPGLVRLAIDVTDSGIGMDPAIVPQMFEAFQQADHGDSRRFGGLGLGLAVCKGIVQQMAGTLELTTAPGRGTTAQLRLTLPQAKDGPPPPPASAAIRQLRILVVDDNAINRKVVSKMLTRMGHAVDVAENGRIAIEAWTACSYDLILMDCQMPVLDGFAATVEIRRLESDQGRLRCPVVALTASVEQRDQEKCSRAGMDGFLGKPAGFDELARAVERHRSR